MKRVWRVHGIGSVAALGILATLAWAETQQMVEYYAFPPITITDPFHVRRLTVGNGYMSVNNPPTDSCIIEGQLFIRTLTSPAGGGTQPVMPLVVAQNAAGNQGGIIRLLGAGTNKLFDFSNNTGQLRVLAEDSAGNLDERIRIMNDGRVHIITDTIVPADPAANTPLQLGARDTTNAGGELRVRGAAANPYFYLENNTGQFRLQMQNAGATREAIRMTNDGKIGFFSQGVGVVNPPTALYVGPRDAANAGGKVLFAEAGGTHTYLFLQNNAGTLELGTEPGGDVIRMKITGTGNVSFGNPAPAPSARLHVAGNLYVGSNTLNMGAGTTTPAAQLHLKGTTGLLIGGPPDGTQVNYAFHAVVNGGQTDLRIGQENGTTGQSQTPPQVVLHPIGGGVYYIGVNITTPAYPFDIGIPAGTAAGHIGDTVEMGAPPGGTWTAAETLRVRGSGIASGSYFTTSTVRNKTDLLPLAPADEQALLAELSELPLYRFHYKDEPRGKQTHIGILAEEAPSAMSYLRPGGQSSLGSELEYATALRAAMKAQKAQIDALKTEVEQLEAELVGRAAR
jgi:hypothetical protein